METEAMTAEAAVSKFGTTGALWQARAAAWELLALSFRYPDHALAEAVSTGEWLEAARELADALELDLPEGFGEGLPACAQEPGMPDAAAAETLLHVLRTEATRLFVGAPEPACSPYEGVHRAEADGVQALLFVNPHSMDVERFMRSCGLGRPEGTNEPLDHIATECELKQYLASLAAGIVKPDADSVAAEDLPGGSAEAAYDRFRAEHLLAWAPSFAVRLESETREPFYRAAAQFLTVNF